jgi:hypothetical protein
MFRCGILSYGCSTAAGPSKHDFWKGLRNGVDHSRPLPGFSSRICAWTTEPRDTSALGLLTRHCLLAWRDCLNGLPTTAQEQLRRPQRLGVILASTKGCIDDWIWQEAPDLTRDPLTPLLEKFVEAAELVPAETLCVSSACASSLTAIFLGREWLRQDRVDQVLVLAADHAGPFVRKGFETLKALTTSRARPFAQDRDGLYLGDGAAAILLGREGGSVEIAGIATDTEGYAVTRPSQSGASLHRACLALPGISDRAPDLIIAHGTGTVINDLTEDQVFSTLFGEHSVPITATKWSIGHTLGASAAMDLIAACESLRHESAFQIANTELIDPKLRSRYLSKEVPLPERLHATRILLTSLGFGGVHAAALVEMPR